MLIVNPVCHKDEHLVLLNLELVKQLDGTIPMDCLITTDRSFNPSKVKAAAKEIFKSVRVYQYDRCPFGDQYPGPQNWAWQNTARFIRANYKEPWFWWEGDAVPLKKGWAETLDQAYLQSGKKFLGTVCRSQQKPYLVGVAVYPPDAEIIMERAIIARSAPFDMVGSILDGVLTSTSESGLIHHVFRQDGSGRTWTASDSPLLPRDAAIYHRCEDGSLQKLLLGRGDDMDKQEVLPTLGLFKNDGVSKIQKDDITFVITTHKRLYFLKRTLGSVQALGTKNIVVVATGYRGPAKGSVRKLAKGLTLIEPQAEDNNLAWLEGVSAARTKWVQIIHDDDGVDPKYFENLVDQRCNSFVLFPSTFISLDPDKDGNLCDGPESERGLRPTHALKSFLNTDNNLSISPVRGLFQRDDLILWLKAAGEHLPRECYLRDTFLVGNDLWLYLSAVEKYDEYLNLKEPCTFLGHHPESCTIKALEQGGEQLRKIYNITRQTFKEVTSQTKLEVNELPRLKVVTIVLDGAPFLMTHLQTFNRLKLDWTWEIVEGVAGNTADTSWCNAIEGRFGRDGTHELLIQLSRHPRIRHYANPFWSNKVEMVNHPLRTASDEQAVLLQVDVDEMWTTAQVEEITKMMLSNQDKDFAMFWCRYFVAPYLYISDTNTFVNNPKHSWRRAWNWRRGDLFRTHEPPVLQGRDQAAFSHEETAERGLVFDHYAYALREQVKFKEIYYGYEAASGKWNRMINEAVVNEPASKYLDWMKNSGLLKTV